MPAGDFIIDDKVCGTIVDNTPLLLAAFLVAGDRKILYSHNITEIIIDLEMLEAFYLRHGMDEHQKNAVIKFIFGE